MFTRYTWLLRQALPLSILFVVLLANPLFPAANNWVVPKGEFGPFKHGTYPSLENKTHVGVDIIAPSGSEVYAFEDGVVVGVITQQDKQSSWAGNAVMILHPTKPRKSYTIYLHLADKPLVSPGQEVEKGKTLLGRVGHTGAANKVDHVHFEIRYFKEWLGPGGNIYLAGDQSKSEVLKNNWDDRVRRFAEQALVREKAPSSQGSPITTNGKLTRPFAVEVLKKSAEFTKGVNCYSFVYSFARENSFSCFALYFEPGDLKDQCNIKDPEVTGITKGITRPFESGTRVEFNLQLTFHPSWLENKLKLVTKEINHWEEVRLTYPENYAANIQSVMSFQDQKSVLTKLLENPVAIRKGVASCVLYDDGWRVNDVEWGGYWMRKLSPEEMKSVEQRR